MLKVSLHAKNKSFAFTVDFVFIFPKYRYSDFNLLFLKIGRDLLSSSNVFARVTDVGCFKSRDDLLNGFLRSELSVSSGPIFSSFSFRRVLFSKKINSEVIKCFI